MYGKSFAPPDPTGRQAADWLNVVMKEKNVSREVAEHLRTAVVLRAHVLAKAGILKPETVVQFLLDRTLYWMIEGKQVYEIMPMLPGNLRDLGALKMRESGGLAGGPMTESDLQDVDDWSRTRKTQ